MPRELIDTRRSKRFVRREKQGQFGDVVDVGKSLAQDRKRKAKRTVKAGEGDRGDQKKRARKTSAGTRTKMGSTTSRRAAKSSAKKSTVRKSSAKKSTVRKSSAKKSPTRARSKAKQSTSRGRGR